jgi:hypothetical protein
MIPRLTNRARVDALKMRIYMRPEYQVWPTRKPAYRPSPAEKRKARNLAISTAMRAMKQRDGVDLHVAYLMRKHHA